MSRTDIRLALPAKGRLSVEAVNLLHACGFHIDKPNPRQYQATIPNLPGLQLIFQRPGDIVVGVRQGSLDFGITGADMVAEKQGTEQTVLMVHDQLGFGYCRLMLAVPREWEHIQTMADLAAQQHQLTQNGRPLRVATKFPRITGAFLAQHNIAPVNLIEAAGTLEVAPAIGYADLIADLVSSGLTLRDNHLRPLSDGTIVNSEAVLIAHKPALQKRPAVLAIARQLLEYIEARLVGQNHYNVFANMRGQSAAAIAARVGDQMSLRGLQGPTISPVFHPQGADQTWYALNIVVPKDELSAAIAQLRAIDGSGVVVTPVTYIFDEEPRRYQEMLLAMGKGKQPAAAALVPEMKTVNGTSGVQPLPVAKPAVAQP